MKQMVKLLLEYGADPNKYRIVTDKNGSISSDSPLGFALVLCTLTTTDKVKYLVNIVKLLLEHGANPNKDSQKQASPLRRAIASKNTEIVKLLLEHGADPNLMEDDYYGNKKSMLTYAIIDAKSKDIVNLLIKHGATWKNTITYKGITKVEKRFPYNRFVSENFLNFLREKGWTGSLILPIIGCVSILIVGLIIIPFVLVLLSLQSLGKL